MSKESSPCFQWYPKDALADVRIQAMTMEEEGCYRRLLDYCWLEGGLPADAESLTSLCKGVKPTPRVLLCFTVSGDVLTHKRLDKERVKQAEWRAKCAIGGQHSASKRKHPKEKLDEQGSCDLVASKTQGKGNIAVCSLQSASKENPSDSLLPKRSKRAPADFQVTEAMRLWAQKEYPGVDVEIETRLFRDYTYKSPRSDWEANWKNWIKNAAGHWHGSGNGSKPAPKVKQAAMSDDEFNFDGEGLR